MDSNIDLEAAAIGTPASQAGRGNRFSTLPFKTGLTTPTGPALGPEGLFKRVRYDVDPKQVVGALGEAPFEERETPNKGPRTLDVAASGTILNICMFNSGTNLWNPQTSRKQ